MRRSKKELVIVIASIVYQMLFGLYIYYCQGQRFYLPYYIMIFGLWAAGQASTKECTYFITFLLLVNVYFNYTLLKRDIVQPFEIYQGVSDIYRNDQNPVKITDTSYPVIVLKSCYDPSLHASDINASSESEIFAAVDSLKPERFTIYGSQTDYGTLEYDIIEDSLSNVGYTVTHIRMPFNWSAGNFNVLKCEQKPN